jgi:hypothetical protein
MRCEAHLATLLRGSGISGRSSIVPPEKQIPEKDTTVKVYSYACKISYPMDAALVEHQMTLSHRHRNGLTEALLEGRKRYRQIIKEHLGLDVKGLEEKDEELTGAIEAIYQELANWKEENRTKKTNPKLAGKLQELKATQTQETVL